MKISIITVCFNSAETIEQTLHSILVQDYSDLECIVIDGGSKDGTLGVVEKYKSLFGQRMKLVSELDNGIYDAMNKGLDFASGDIVGFLNSDDHFVDCGVITSYAREFCDSATEAVFADLSYIDMKDPKRLVRTWKSGAVPPSKMKWGWHPAHPTFYVRKAVYDKLGKFDTKFRIAADYEIMLRFIQKHGISCKYLEKCAVNMRTGGISNKSIRNIAKANMECVRAWKSNGLDVPPLMIAGKILWKASQLAYLNRISTIKE